jgi:cell shape-determining protein MreC
MSRNNKNTKNRNLINIVTVHRLNEQLFLLLGRIIKFFRSSIPLLLFFIIDFNNSHYAKTINTELIKYSNQLIKSIGSPVLIVNNIINKVRSEVYLSINSKQLEEENKNYKILLDRYRGNCDDLLNIASNVAIFRDNKYQKINFRIVGGVTDKAEKIALKAIDYKDKIKIGTIVTDGVGVVGRIIEFNDDIVIMQTVYDSTFSIPVINRRNMRHGIISSNNSLSLANLEIFTDNAAIDIINDDLLVTDEYYNLIPSNIVVGNATIVDNKMNVKLAGSILSSKYLFGIIME